MNRLSPREANICESVMNKIAQRRIMHARVKSGLYGFFLICAILAVIPSADLLITRAVASGFTQYISLILSDGGSLAGSWGVLAMSIVESIPVAGITMTLLTLTLSAFLAQRFVITRDLLSRSMMNATI